MLNEALANWFGGSWTRGEIEALTITLIGIGAPVGFSIFIHYLLKRSADVERDRNAEMTEFLKGVRRKYAEDEISQRRRAASKGL